MKKRLSADIQKPKILESFHQTIIEEGFEGASIAKVAARIGMNPTLILHYFGTKENLTLAGVDHVIAIYAKLLGKFRETKDLEPEERLNALLNIFWSKAYYEKIHVAVAFATISASFRNPAIKKKIQGLYTLFKATLTKILEDLKRDGAVAVNDVDGAVMVLIAMIEGSRHFRHLFVKTKDVQDFNRYMIDAALKILKTP